MKNFVRKLKLASIRRKRRKRDIRLGLRKKRIRISWETFGLKLLDVFILKKFLGTYLFATMLILACHISRISSLLCLLL